MATELRVSQVEQLTDDAVAISFEVPAGADFSFAPGQHLTLRHIVDGVEHRRSYSICSAPGEPLRVGVRLVQDGAVSTWLTTQVRPGQRILADPPTGRFHAGDLTGGRHLLLAAGSGITPMIGIASALLDRGAHVCLVYANRRTATVMFADELADLKDAHLQRFQLIHVLSREPRDVDLFSGRLERERLVRILDELVGEVDHAWLCGPHQLVTTARAVLAGRAGQVHTELFFVEEEPPQPTAHLERPPSGPTSRVTVVLDGKATTAVLPTDQTVLDAAQQVRADLPFACKGGVCGTCRARVTSGEVDMRRNYALEEAEVEAGFVLTCQSHPVSAAVTIDFDA